MTHYARILPALAASTMLLATCAFAQTSAPDNTVLVDAPPPPPPIESGEYLEPEVTIVQSEEQTVYEYRFGGRLHAIKVVPQAGPSYFLIDTDGDGRLEHRSNAYGPQFLVNSWVLLSW
jgi:hypothetical protein